MAEGEIHILSAPTEIWQCYILWSGLCGNWNRYPEGAEMAFVSNESINFLQSFKVASR